MVYKSAITIIFSISLAVVAIAAWTNGGALHVTAVAAYFATTVVLMLVFAVCAHLLDRALGGYGSRAVGLGYLVGLVFLIDLLVEYAVNLGHANSAAATGFFLLSVLSIVATSGLLTARATSSVKRGVQAALVTMLIGVGSLIGFGFLAVIVAQNRLQPLLQPETLTGVDIGYYPFAASLEDAVTHLTEAPILAAIFGGLGALVGSRLKSTAAQRSKA